MVTRTSLAAPERIPTLPRIPAGLPLQALELLPTTRCNAGLTECWQPGEADAQQRLESFCADAVMRYRNQRDYPASPATSKLSPHLHFGEISPLACVTAIARRLAMDASPGLSRNVEGFIRELGWREFAYHLLYHCPHTPQVPLQTKFEALPWRTPGGYAYKLRAWQRGCTGIPSSTPARTLACGFSTAKLSTADRRSQALPPTSARGLPSASPIGTRPGAKRLTCTASGGLCQSVHDDVRTCKNSHDHRPLPEHTTGCG
ncbi:MAG: hypothetical protein KGJ55_06960 [Gammaproteobacteria bacterium]|nr:hypothetical protein [Gammaproteobacteria bacterium]